MIPREILDKVQQIEIQTGRLVNNLFAGEYHSVFKGHGMEFAEVREYQPGDDVRAIDWNVTARAGGKPFVKVYDEERELTVVLVVDANHRTPAIVRCRLFPDQVGPGTGDSLDFEFRPSQVRAT